MIPILTGVSILVFSILVFSILFFKWLDELLEFLRIFGDESGD